MKRRTVLVTLLLAAALLTFPLLTGCTDLNGGTGSTETTVPGAATTVSESTTTLAVTTTGLPPAATTSTLHPPVTSAATTTSTIGLMQINPGLLHTNPSLLRIDSNLMVTPTRYEDTHPFLHWEWEDVWKSQVGLAYSGGSQMVSKEFHSYVQITFHGTGVQLVATKSPTAGKLIAHLNGPGVAKNETIDLYSAVAKYQQNVWYSGYLTTGDYAVYFEWDPGNASGKPVFIDAVDVWGTVTPP